MIGIVLAFFNVVASSQILPLLPKAGAKVIQFPDLQKIIAGRKQTCHYIATLAYVE